MIRNNTQYVLTHLYEDKHGRHRTWSAVGPKPGAHGRQSSPLALTFPSPHGTQPELFS